MLIRPQVIAWLVLVAGSVGATWLAQDWRYGAKLANKDKAAAVALSDAQAAARQKE